MILQQFTSYVLVCQMNNFIIYNTHLQTLHEGALGAEKTRRLNLHATITMTKIDNTIRTILTHMAPPCTASEKYNTFEWG